LESLRSKEGITNCLDSEHEGIAATPAP